MKTCLKNCAPGDVIVYGDSNRQYKVKQPMNKFGAVLTDCLYSAAECIFTQSLLDAGNIKKIVKARALS